MTSVDSPTLSIWSQDKEGCIGSLLSGIIGSVLSVSDIRRDQSVPLARRGA